MLEEREQAILIGVNLGNNNFEKQFTELEALAEACNIDVCGKITQNLSNVNNALYVGTGKLAEISQMVKGLNADLIIFNNELTSTQLRNLEKHLDVPIMDRTSLILRIFSDRARTREAKLQVEVAKLQYMLPRLKGLHDSLGRQGGGGGASPANKGSGEKKLELDRRKIEQKLTEYKKELDNLVYERENQRKQRRKSGIKNVALAGYTNAGKSTLMNAFVEMTTDNVDKKVLQKDMLFATLETSVRNITLDNKKSFLLSDTVGFVDELPHSLIKAFRSTLEEIVTADLILHVVDFSDPDYERYIKVTEDTLKELKADKIPVIYVYNKSDKNLFNLPVIEDNRIYMSAETKEGMEELISMISDIIFSDYVDVKLLIPYEKGNVVSYLMEKATIKETKYLENGTYIDAEITNEDYPKYKEYETNEKIQ